MEGAACDPPHSSPSTGLTSFSSGTLRTLTTSPSCPSPPTTSGSQTFSSMSCECCPPVLGCPVPPGLGRDRAWGHGSAGQERSHPGWQHCQGTVGIVLGPNSPLCLVCFLFSFSFLFKNSFFLCLMLKLCSSWSEGPLPGGGKLRNESPLLTVAE